LKKSRNDLIQELKINLESDDFISVSQILFTLKNDKQQENIYSNTIKQIEFKFKKLSEEIEIEISCFKCDLEKAITINKKLGIFEHAKDQLYEFTTNFNFSEIFEQLKSKLENRIIVLITQLGRQMKEGTSNDPQIEIEKMKNTIDSLSKFISQNSDELNKLEEILTIRLVLEDKEVLIVVNSLLINNSFGNIYYHIIN